MPTDSLPEPLKTFHDTGFEEIEHTADCALHIFGKNFLKLLTNAALGMTSLMAFEPSAIADDTTRHVELEAMDAESLLVEWLSELAYWAEMEMLVFHRFELCNVTPNHLQAVIHGGHVFNSIMEKDVFHHLEFIDKTVRIQKKRIRMEPYCCLNCGFEFKNRKRFKKPGKCPSCRDGRIAPAVFWIAP